jgi:transposase
MPFFTELGAPKSYQIQVFVMDTWDPYISPRYTKTRTLRSFLTCFTLRGRSPRLWDKVRRQEFANADVATRKKYKKKRFLILKRGKRLHEEKRETLHALMAENERLYQAYLLKEQALDIFEERDEATALNRLDKWFENVKEAGISAI